MKLNIKWTDDCQGKKDYDGDLVAVSTRFWPGYMTVFDSNHPEKGLHDVVGGRHSATCSIMISDGYKHHNGETTDLITKDFEGDSFEEVAKQVEAWAQTQADRVYRAIRKEFGGI